MPKRYEDAIRWLFGLFVVGTSSMLLSTLRDISKSIDTLNVQVAVVIEKVAGHDRSILQQDERIRRVEEKINRATRRPQSY